MGTRFLGGTKHYEFEMMMQELPHTHTRHKGDKKLKSGYFRMLERFLEEKGFDTIRSRVFKGVKSMFFDEFCFASEEHESTFKSAYGRLISLKCGNDNEKVAVIVPSQQKWTQKSFKKRNESYSFFCFRKTAAFIPRFA